MKIALYTLLLLSLACSSPTEPGTGGSAPDPTGPATSGPVETSTPAPGTEPIPAITGDGAFVLSSYEDYPPEVQGCDCALYLDDGRNYGDKWPPHLFVYDLPDGPGVLIIDNERMIVEPTNNGEALPPHQGRTTYYHQNDRYRIETSLFDEGDLEDGSMVSGTITVTDRGTGKSLTARVGGACQC